MLDQQQINLINSQNETYLKTYNQKTNAFLSAMQQVLTPMNLEDKKVFLPILRRSIEFNVDSCIKNNSQLLNFIANRELKLENDIQLKEKMNSWHKIFE